MSEPNPPTSRRSFLARTAAVMAAPSIAMLAVDAVSNPASAATPLPDYAPIPPSAVGPALNE